LFWGGKGAHTPSATINNFKTAGSPLRCPQSIEGGEGGGGEGDPYGCKGFSAWGNSTEDHRQCCQQRHVLPGGLRAVHYEHHFAFLKHHFNFRSAVDVPLLLNSCTHNTSPMQSCCNQYCCCQVLQTHISCAFSLFHSRIDSLRRGATCDSSNILAQKHWLESTGGQDVRQTKAGENSAT